MQHVTLYTKEGCTLCKGVKATLEELLLELDFSLEEIDITSDPATYERYRNIIPVVIITHSAAGRTPITLTSRIREDDLRQALAPREHPLWQRLKSLFGW